MKEVLIFICFLLIILLFLVTFNLISNISDTKRDIKYSYEIIYINDGQKISWKTNNCKYFFNTIEFTTEEGKTITIQDKNKCIVERMEIIEK